MRHNITAYTEHAQPATSKVVEYVSINTEAGDYENVLVSARDRAGRQVEVRVPWPEFRRMMLDAQFAIYNRR